MNCVVRCRGLTKTFGSGETRVAALQGVDLDIFPGEIFMLTGPSGSGKTTLLSILSGILEQDEGECTVYGQDLRQLNSSARARFRSTSIGFVFQVFNLLPALNAVENISVPLLINKTDRKKADATARIWLEKVGLEPRAKALPSQLSGGQQQRVAIARALVHEPRLIACDEPTSNLDHMTGQNVMEILKNTSQSPDRAVVVVTHDPRIFPYADRIAKMDDGKIVELLEGKDRDRLK